MVFAIYFTASWVSLVAQMVKSLPTMQETWIWSLGQGDPLEKEMAAHSSILAWEIPRTEELDRLESIGSQKVRHNWVTNTLFKKDKAYQDGFFLTIFLARIYF